MVDEFEFYSRSQIIEWLFKSDTFFYLLGIIGLKFFLLVMFILSAKKTWDGKIEFLMDFRFPAM